MAKRPAPAPEAVPASRQERILFFMFASILGLSIIAIVALFIGGPTKTGVIWATVALLPLIGIPLAILLLVAIVVINGVRRARLAKGDGH